MMLAAGITSGHLFAADVCFLIAVILAALATITATPAIGRAAPADYVAALASGALAAVALGWLLL